MNVATNEKHIDGKQSGDDYVAMTLIKASGENPKVPRIDANIAFLSSGRPKFDSINNVISPPFQPVMVYYILSFLHLINR